ncbi:uncharacterized protein LOC144616792 [Panthera onca]
MVQPGTCQLSSLVCQCHCHREAWFSFLNLDELAGSSGRRFLFRKEMEEYKPPAPAAPMAAFQLGLDPLLSWTPPCTFLSASGGPAASGCWPTRARQTFSAQQRRWLWRQEVRENSRSQWEEAIRT